jgi:ABC-type amino acid transport system permease subunit
METSIQKLVAICFLVTGLSHIMQPRVWAQFFIMFREKGEVGSFLSGLLHFPLGALIVAFHHGWRGIPLLVTLMGWGLVIKSLVYLTYPKHGMRMLARISVERSWEFVVAGVMAVALGGLMLFPLLGR